MVVVDGELPAVRYQAGEVLLLHYRGAGGSLAGLELFVPKQRQHGVGELAAREVVQLRGLVEDLVEADADEIGDGLTYTGFYAAAMAWKPGL